MKKIHLAKKIITAVSLTIFSAVSISALTWSGVIDDSTKLSTTDFSTSNLSQSNGIYLSLNSKFDDLGLRFSSECSYKYSLNVPFTSSPSATFINIVDLSLLKLSGKWALPGGSFSANLGRFSYSDLSGTVFTQNSDGIHLSYDTLKTSASLYAGYTGLINSLNVSMVDSYFYEYDFYNLCAGYIPVVANFSYKSFFHTNTISFQLSGFLEPKKEFSSKYYAALSLSGPIKTLGQYSFSTVLGTQEFKDMMLYSSLNLTFFLSKVMFGAGIEYASGNQFGLSPFKTITYQTGYSSAAGGEKSAVILPKISGTLASANFSLSLAEKLVVSAPDAFYLSGLESNCNFIINVFSDLQVSSSLLIYADFADRQLNNYSLSAGFIMQF